MLDVTTALNVVSTFVLIGALVFTALQVRTANRVRAEQAALALIAAVQNESWAHTLRMVEKIPPGKTADEISGLGPDVTHAVEAYGLRLETVGYMVFRGFVSLETIDQLLGGITVINWSHVKPWVERNRELTMSPRQFEWFQWLAERLEDRHTRATFEPAYLKHARWKPSDVRPTA